MRQRYPGDVCMGGKQVAGAVRMHGQRLDPTATITMNGAGLHLAMAALIPQAWHAPLFVPWDDVTVVIDDAEDEGDLPLWVGDSKVIVLSGPAARAVKQAMARLTTPSARRAPR